jgi:hypothetical protein
MLARGSLPRWSRNHASAPQPFLDGRGCDHASRNRPMSVLRQSRKEPEVGVIPLPPFANFPAAVRKGLESLTEVMFNPQATGLILAV